MYAEFGVRPHLTKVSAAHGISSHFFDLRTLRSIRTSWFKHFVNEQPQRLAGIGINLEEVPARHCSHEVIDGICAVSTWCEQHGIPLQVIARSSCQIWGHPLISALFAQGAYFGTFPSCALGNKARPHRVQVQEEFGMCAHIPSERQMSCTSATRFWHLLFACVTDKLVAKYICQNTQGGGMGFGGEYGHKVTDDCTSSLGQTMAKGAERD
eukprot:3524187-Amphidinium_carterae.1